MSLIRLVLGPSSATNIRFGISPALETVELLLFLSGVDREKVSAPWIRDAIRRLDRLGVDELLDTVRSETYCPEFLHPASGERNGPEDFRSQLGIVRETPLDQVELELDLAYVGRHCDWMGASIEDARNILADQLARCYQEIVRPMWPRVEAIARTDIRTRGERLSAQGLHDVVNGLHARLSLRDDAIELRRVSTDSPYCESVAGERGVVLIPTVFGRRRAAIGLSTSGPSQVMYWARGWGLLDESSNGNHDLTRVLGSTRVALLSAALQPTTTKDLAVRFDLAPATVSHHLTAMADVGWLSRERIGRSVVYKTTDVGRMILTERHAS